MRPKFPYPPPYQQNCCPMDCKQICGQRRFASTFMVLEITVHLRLYLHFLLETKLPMSQEPTLDTNYCQLPASVTTPIRRTTQQILLQALWPHRTCVGFSCALVALFYSYSYLHLSLHTVGRDAAGSLLQQGRVACSDGLLHHSKQHTV